MMYHADSYLAKLNPWGGAMPTTLPTDSSERKAIPLATGVLDYFPAALAAVAQVSKAGNDKHNPGQPLHHSRGKSTDHADSVLRHLAERGGIDPETGQRYSAQLAWRALALLQQELEDAGEAPLPRGASYDDDEEMPKRRDDIHDAVIENNLINYLETEGDFSPGVMAEIRRIAGVSA